ncbi:mitoferrin-1 isoform X2 [Mixophyes fleayi]|uniref:mitoferrin-1 isoform X2 n=1 Tax=Mixophyes fleayi TaxID=3061075 RepID=UPI003F4E0919
MVSWPRPGSDVTLACVGWCAARWLQSAGRARPVRCIQGRSPRSCLRHGATKRRDPRGGERGSPLLAPRRWGRLREPAGRGLPADAHGSRGRGRNPGALCHVSGGLCQGVAGSLATVLHDAVMNPAEVVKQRMQMYNSPYRSMLHCIQNISRTEGVGAFYRSYTTQLFMNIPFQAIHFITYELTQERLNPQRQYHPGSHIVSGAIAGAVAAAATTPLDVCKTLLNTQENMALSSVNISGHLSGMVNAIRTVYQLGGMGGYFKGVQARVIYQMPSTAIAWSVYEFFKYFLSRHHD